MGVADDVLVRAVRPLVPAAAGTVGVDHPESVVVRGRGGDEITLPLPVECLGAGADLGQLPAAGLRGAEADLEDIARAAALAVAVPEAVDPVLDPTILVAEAHPEVDVPGGGIGGALLRPVEGQLDERVDATPAHLLGGREASRDG